MKIPDLKGFNLSGLDESLKKMHQVEDYMKQYKGKKICFEIETIEPFVEGEIVCVFPDKDNLENSLFLIRDQESYAFILKRNEFKLMEDMCK